METIDIIVRREGCPNIKDKLLNAPLSDNRSDIEKQNAQVTERGYFELKKLSTYDCQANME